MKKDNASRKLSLNTETLVSLNNAELDAVNGGITPTVVVASGAAVSGFAASVGIYRAFFPRPN